MTSTPALDAPAPADGATGGRWAVLADRVRELRAELMLLHSAGGAVATDPEGGFAGSEQDTHEMVSFLTAAEELTSALAGAQVLATAEFTVVHGVQLANKNRPAERIGSSIGSQVGMARKQSPHRGSTLVRNATTLVGNLPHTLAALFDGTISEYRAGLVASRAGWLSDELQRQLDAEIAPRLGGLGDGRVADLAVGIAYRLDPEGAAERVRGALSDRHVSIRPAPETMVRLSALLPVTDGVAAYAALRARAEELIGEGDPRNRGQIMADELIARLVCAATATATATAGADTPAPAGAADRGSPVDPAPPVDPAASADDASAGACDPADDCSPVPADDTDPDCDPAGSGMEDLLAALGITAAADAAKEETSPVAGGLGRSLEVLLIMTDRTLLGLDSAPGHLIGYGAIPAALARDLALGRRTGALDPPDRIRIRRMFTDPAGRLVAMESRSRTFTPGMRRFLLARDQRCRNPWCNSPIAHGDHTRDRAHGGPTSLPNGNGKCARCNLDKNTGFTNTTTDNGHTITVTTPTGHTYRSTAPPTPGTTDRPSPSNQGTDPDTPDQPWIVEIHHPPADRTFEYHPAA